MDELSVRQSDVLTADPPETGSVFVRRTRTPYVNVRDYGATGNGTTDDSAAFSAAAIRANGKRLYVPGGTYKVPYFDLTGLSGMTVEGDGESSIIKGRLNLTTGNFLRGLAFDGNKAGGTVTRGIECFTQHDCGGEWLWLYNHGNAAMRVTNPYDQTWEHIDVRGPNGIGMDFEINAGLTDATGMTLDYLYVDRSTGTGSFDCIRLNRSGAVGNWVKTKLHRFDVIGNGGTANVELISPDRASVKDGFSQAGNMGVSLAQPTSCTVAGNNIASVAAQGIEIAGALRTTIANNVINAAATRGIDVNDAAGTQQAENVTLTGNVIYGSGVHAIRLYRHDNVVIAGNNIRHSIAGATNAAIDSQATGSGNESRLVISGNQIDCRTTATYAIKLLNGTQYLGGAGNHIHDYATAGIRYEGVTLGGHFGPNSFASGAGTTASYNTTTLGFWHPSDDFSSQWLNILEGVGNLTGGETVGSYAFRIDTPVSVISGAAGADKTLSLIYLDPAEYAGNVPTTGGNLKLRLQGDMWEYGTTAPGQTINVCLFPFSVTTGNITLGAAALSAVVTPASANGRSSGTSSEINFPAAGMYALGFSIGGTIAAGHDSHLTGRLQVRWEKKQ